MKTLTPAHGRRAWNQFKDGELCHLTVMAEYTISPFEYLFIVHSDVTGRYMLGIFDSCANGLKFTQEFATRKEADSCFIERIASR